MDSSPTQFESQKSKTNPKEIENQGETNIQVEANRRINVYRDLETTNDKEIEKYKDIRRKRQRKLWGEKDHNKSKHYRKLNNSLHSFV